MPFLNTLKKDFKDIPYLKAVKRVFDDKPIHCNLFVTDRCNLDCAYCTEYDNSQSHPALEDLKKRIDKIVELGVIKIALVGGEPLLHPEITEVIRYVKEKGITASISTNGYLLRKEMVDRLVAAGLDIIQISVDRKTPSPVSRKSLATIIPLLDYLLRTDIKVHISGVICEDTADEAEDVLQFGLERDIPTELRLLHGDTQRGFLTAPASAGKALELIDLQIKLKAEGKTVHTTSKILDYQRESLEGGRKDGRPPDWTCLAGYKIFFVSAQGDFWLCSQVKTSKKIEEITLADLKSYNHKKDCQSGCGIYCVVSNSLFIQDPLSFIAREIPCKVKRVLSQWQQKT